MTSVLVLGAGVSGRATVDLARRVGDSVRLVDPDGRYDGPPDVPVSPTLTPGLVDGCDVVVTSPGIPEDDPMITMVRLGGVPLWSEIEYASHFLDIPIVAITGTNGKTTVTRAAAAMLVSSGIDAVAAGNIGDPLSDVVGTDAAVAVVEVSSFQLATVERFHPVASAVLNVAPDHLDWHTDLESYHRAKARIFARQLPDELCVHDADDPGSTELVRDAPCRVVAVSGRRRPPGGWGVEGAAESGEDRLVVGPVSVPLAAIESGDPISLSNLTAAAVLALHVGAGPAPVADVIKSFRPDRHRRTLVAEIGGVRWVNDSKATNPHAALASIAAESSVVLIAGGLAKGLDVRPLATAPGVRYVIGIGEAGPGLVAAAEDGQVAVDMADAIRIAAGHAQPGDTVLLAPGCASFDEYDSYVHRGERFTAAVDGMAERSRR